MLSYHPRLFLAAGLAAALAAALASVAAGEQSGRLAGVVAGAPARAASNDPATPRVGDRLDPGRLHQVTRPGLYGMSQPPAGSRYGIMDGNLIRYDPEKVHLLSIIRQVDRILD